MNYSECTFDMLNRAIAIAFSFGHRRYSDVHLFLAMITDKKSIAYKSLEGLGLDADVVASELTKTWSVQFELDMSTTRAMPPEAIATNVLDGAEREVANFGRSAVRPEFILLAMIYNKDSKVGEVLRGLAVEIVRAREAVFIALEEAGFVGLP